MDCGKRARRANIFTCAAASAALRIHNRLFGGIIRPHQIYHPWRAYFGAGSAGYLVRHGYAALKDNDGPPDLHGAFYCRGDRPYGPCGADFRAGHAVDAAITPLKGKGGLQHAAAHIRCPQHLIGTGRNAELTPGAARAKHLRGLRPRRHNGRLPLMALPAGKRRNGRSASAKGKPWYGNANQSCKHAAPCAIKLAFCRCSRRGYSLWLYVLLRMSF
mgnify:CR=1 FL=1